jgi:DNA-binding NtrC family response regulator
MTCYEVRLQRYARAMLVAAMEKSVTEDYPQGHVALAAKSLGLSKTTMYRKMKELGVPRPAELRRDRHSPAEGPEAETLSWRK